MKRNLTLLISAAVLIAGMIGLSASSASADVKNASKPTISGQARIDVTLSASRGGWQAFYPAHNTVTYRYQWLKDGVPIPDATAKTYTPRDRSVYPYYTDTDLGSRISVRVTAVWKRAGLLNSPTYTAQAESAATSPVLPGLMTAGNPSIVGTPKVGALAELKIGTWTPDFAFNVKWFAVDTSGSSTLLRQCEWIHPQDFMSRANCVQLVIPSEAAGKKLKAEVTGSAPSYLPKTRTGTQLGFVQGAGAAN